MGSELATKETIITYSIFGLNERIIDSDDLNRTMFNSVG